MRKLIGVLVVIAVLSISGLCMAYRWCGLTGGATGFTTVYESPYRALILYPIDTDAFFDQEFGSGLDAALLPSANTCRGIRYSDTAGLEFNQSGAWAPLGGGFVNRGDPAAADFVLANFTTDGNPHDLNLSGIIPAGAKYAVVNIIVNDGTLGSYIQVRPNGNTYWNNAQGYRVQSTSIANQGTMVIALDANRIIEYVTSATTFTNISLTVCGWSF